jgi:hypothetical protein
MKTRKKCEGEREREMNIEKKNFSNMKYANRIITEWMNSFVFPKLKCHWRVMPFSFSVSRSPVRSVRFAANLLQIICYSFSSFLVRISKSAQTLNCIIFFIVNEKIAGLWAHRSNDAHECRRKWFINVLCISAPRARPFKGHSMLISRKAGENVILTFCLSSHFVDGSAGGFIICNIICKDVYSFRK